VLSVIASHADLIAAHGFITAHGELVEPGRSTNREAKQSRRLLIKRLR